MSDQQKIEVGDVVRISSTDLQMTVDYITSDTAYCIWFNKEYKLEKAEISLQALVLLYKKI